MSLTHNTVVWGFRALKWERVGGRGGGGPGDEGGIGLILDLA